MGTAAKQQFLQFVYQYLCVLIVHRICFKVQQISVELVGKLMQYMLGLRKIRYACSETQVLCLYDRSIICDFCRDTTLVSQKCKGITHNPHHLHKIYRQTLKLRLQKSYYTLAAIYFIAFMTVVVFTLIILFGAYFAGLLGSQNMPRRV